MTARQTLFVDNYLKTQSATKAARAAGYAESSCGVTGSRLLKNPIIAAKIAAAQAKSEKKSANLADRVLSELSSLAFGNLADCFDPETGELLPINKLPREVAATLTAFENDKGFQKVKTASKLSALELLAKITQLVKQDHQNTQAIQIIVREAPSRVEPTVSVGALRPEWD